jgi:putative heme-binding domain-containing protein
MIYQGDNWPDEYRGRAFTLNFHGRRINQEVLQREGNSFVGKHAPDMFQTSDPWFRGVELTYGPDGAVYVLDWSDIGECHENDGIHRTSGRIFKISYGKPKKPEFDDLNELSDDKLVDLLGHKNAWYPRMAQRILCDRWANVDNLRPKRLVALAKGKAVDAESDPPSTRHRLNAIGTLYCATKGHHWLLLDFAESDNEHVRAMIVRLLANRPIEIERVASKILDMANDPSPLVRLYVASAIGRLRQSYAFAVAQRLVAFDDDMKDRVQPKLIWHQIEPFIAGDYRKSVSLFSGSRSQMLRRNIVRRLACDPERQDEMLEKLTQKMVLSANSNDAPDILHGIKAAVEGRKKMKAPKSWPFNSAKGDSKTSKLIAEISPVFGDGLSMDRLMKVAANKEVDTVARQQAILSLSQFADPKDLFPLLKGHVKDRMVSTAVVKAMAVCDHDEIPSLILNEYRRLSSDGKRNAIDTLCVRKKWANKLLGAVERGRVESSELTAWHARQIQMFDDGPLTERLAKAWGKVRETDQERVAQIDNLREMMNKDLSSADVTSGRKLFATHCASCHVMFGEGGNIGPDLTGADRKNLNYLLENIVDPSASVATSYRASVLAMEDGRLLTGVVMDNDGQTLKLQTQEELVTLEVSAVEEIKQTELSLMPEKLLDKLSNKEKVDLFGYLMSK